MDHPNDGDEEGVEEEHDGFFFQDTELHAVDVIEAEILHEDSHHGCREEQTQRVLQAKGVLVFTACTMHFDVGEEMQDVGYAEFVEKDDKEHGQQSGS
jgi:hypothetical protein